MVPNEDECTVGEGDGGSEKETTFRLVDFPGHVKLRSGSEAYLEKAKKVVFVTDSLVYNQNEKVREAAR